jgi:hypothetical protein
MYVNKKLILLVAFVELGKLVNWVHIVFNNLCSMLQNLSITIKLKYIYIGKNMEFGATRVIDIILCN